MAIVTADGHMTAKVVCGPDFAKMMVPAELAVGVAGDQVKQYLTLDRLGVQRLVKESAGQATGAANQRLADKPLNRLKHSSVGIEQTRFSS